MTITDELAKTCEFYRAEVARLTAELEELRACLRITQDSDIGEAERDLLEQQAHQRGKEQGAREMAEMIHDSGRAAYDGPDVWMQEWRKREDK